MFTVCSNNKDVISYPILAKGATQFQKILMRMRQSMRDMPTASYCMKMCLHEEGAVGADVTVDAKF